jgi:hypothetical protein
MIYSNAVCEGFAAGPFTSVLMTGHGLKRNPPSVRPHVRVLGYIQIVRPVILFAITGTLCAQLRPDPTDVLAHARDAVLERRQTLPNYTCSESVDRKYFRPLIQQTVHSCDRASESDTPVGRGQLYLTDRLRLDVKVSHGTEIGSWAGASQFDPRTIFDLVGKGPFGTGPFGPFLSDIFGGGASFEYDGVRQSGRTKSYEYSFRVPLSASHYSVEVGRDWRALAYDGLIRVDPESFDVTYLLVRASQFPEETETCEAVTTVDFGRVPMNTGEFPLAQQSRLHLIMSDGDENEITTVYTACREYHGEASVVFGDESAKITTQQNGIEPPTKLIPPGLRFTLALADTIDTETAAAGDVVVEKVRKAVRAHWSGDVFIPAGVTVRGRIIRMRHWLESPPRCEIAIRLETWETGGRSRPIYAKPADEYRTPASGLRRRVPITLPPEGESAGVATIVRRASQDRYVPPGFESNWITTTAPPNR